MLVLEVLVTVLVLAGVALLAAGRGDAMSEVGPDLAEVLPVGAPVTAEWLAELRLPVALRGYRMSEVDQLLERLTDRLRELEGAGQPESVQLDSAPEAPPEVPQAHPEAPQAPREAQEPVAQAQQ
ncbi:MAG: DivIVA domain-containing protein, partial [Mycobacteriales bacterium]